MGSGPSKHRVTKRFWASPLQDGELVAGGMVGKVAGAFKQQPPFRLWGARPLKPPLVSLGLGGSLELDQAGLLPHMRVKFQDWLTVKVHLQQSPPCPRHPIMCWVLNEHVLFRRTASMRHMGVTVSQENSYH